MAMLAAEVGAGWAEVGAVAWVGAILLSPTLNPFHTDPRLASARGQGSSLACRPILPSIQRIIVGGVSMLHDPGHGPGGGVEVLVAVIFAFPTHNPPLGPHLDTSHWTRPGQPTVASQVFRHG